MTKPKDKSKLSIEERTRKVLRVNQENPAHALAPLNDKNPAKYVRGGVVVNPKRPGQALPHGDNLFKRDTYVVGDGERMQSGRPGADDHLKIKSRGHSV
jgi:hypothetical protein